MKKIISVVFERRRMIFIDHFFFFCIIANSLHPASNLDWFFPFLFQESPSAASSVYGMGVLDFSPQFLCLSNCLFIFILIAASCLRCVFGLIFNTFLRRGAGAPVETSKWAVLQRKRFPLLFLCSHFCCPGGLCFQFHLVWKSSHPGLRTAFGFLTAATTKSVCKQWQMVQVERTEPSI